MRALFPLFFLLSYWTVLGQQRLAIEGNCTFDNVYGTVNYSQSLKNNWLLHAGFSYGSYSYNWVYRTGSDVLLNIPLKTPYLEMNTPPSPNYYLTSYQSRNNGYAAEIGLGRIWKIMQYNSVRMNLTVKGYYLSEALFGFYIEDALNNSTKYQSHEELHKSFSVAYECVHEIEFTDFITVYYGLKLPYLFPVRTAQYQPVGRKDAMIGFQPNFVLGVGLTINKKLIKQIRNS